MEHSQWASSRYSGNLLALWFGRILQGHVALVSRPSALGMRSSSERYVSFFKTPTSEKLTWSCSRLSAIVIGLPRQRWRRRWRVDADWPPLIVMYRIARHNWKYINAWLCRLCHVDYICHNHLQVIYQKHTPWNIRHDVRHIGIETDTGVFQSICNRIYTFHTQTHTHIYIYIHTLLKICC